MMCGDVRLDLCVPAFVSHKCGVTFAESFWEVLRTGTYQGFDDVTW